MTSITAKNHAAPRVNLPTLPAALPQQPIAPSAAPLATDKLHISPQGRLGRIPVVGVVFANSQPEISDQEQAKKDFIKPIQVDAGTRKPFNRFLWVLAVTPSQEDKLKTAEIKHFGRFEYGSQRAEQGSITHQIRQSFISANNPGYQELLPRTIVTVDDEKRVQKAMQDYGIEAAAIAITGKNENELKDYLEDKFFISLFNRDKEEFEDYFKNGYNDFFDNMFGRNNPDNEIPAALAQPGEKPPEAPRPEEYRWKFFKPSLGIKARGLDYQELTLKPKVDLVRLRGPQATDVRLTAEVPVNFKGEYEPEFELRMQRVLFPATEYGSYLNNIFVESRTQYEMMNHHLKTTFGLRKQFGPDSSLGFFGMYSQTFEDVEAEDLGLGLNYQIRFK